MVRRRNPIMGFGGINLSNRPASLPKSPIERPNLNAPNTLENEQARQGRQFVNAVYRSARKSGGELSEQSQQLLQGQKGGGQIFKIDQSWRVFGQYQMGGQIQTGIGGKLGSTALFDSELIILLQLNDAVFQQYDMIARMYPPHRGLNERLLLSAVQTEMYQKLKNDLFVIINKIVPQDSGRLRNSMELAINGGRAGSGGATSMTSDLRPFSVVVNTGDLKYARPVNAMPTPWLAHPHAFGSNKGYKFGRTVTRRSAGSDIGPRGAWRHNLNDPSAQTGWFYDVVYKGRTIAQQKYQQFLNYLTSWAELTPVIQYFQGVFNHPGQSNIAPIIPATTVVQSLFSVRYS